VNAESQHQFCLFEKVFSVEIDFCSWGMTGGSSIAFASDAN
jgi:hypothetical protein